MTTKPSIGVIGAGLYGTTLSIVFANNGYPVNILTEDKTVEAEINNNHKNPRFPELSSLPDNITATHVSEKFCRDNRTIFLAMPPQRVLSVLNGIRSYLEGDHVLVHTLRYLFNSPPVSLSQYIWDQTIVRKVAVITGPVYFDELLNRNPVSLIIASPFDQVREDIKKMVATPWVRLYENDDLEGVEWCSSLTNIGLVVSGLAAGLGYGASTVTFLIARMVNEISYILKYLGKDQRLAHGMAGMGTITSGCLRKDDLFYLMGERMGTEKNSEKAIRELKYGNAGPQYLENIYHWGLDNNLDLPLTEAMYRIFIKNEDIIEVQKWLLSRPMRHEFI